MLKIIFFGDVCGEPGRLVLRKVLPEIKLQEQPDLILANVENLAHGKGVTVKTLEQLIDAGVRGFTAGNHIYSKKELSEETLNKYSDRIVRPVNISDSYSGSTAAVFETSKGKVLIGNFLGQVFMERQFHDPIDSEFKMVEDWLKQNLKEDIKVSLIDLHAEATSEKVAFGYFLDGRVSAVVGTHTHIPTADAKILPKGTAYITDVGMCGAAGTVLGIRKELSIERFTTGQHVAFNIPEDAKHAELSYVIINIDEQTGKAVDIQAVHKIIEL